MFHAEQNPQKSEFPDFIFENGFIERFSVASYIPNQMSVSTKGEDLEIFTYKDYVKLFQKNRAKHIES